MKRASWEQAAAQVRDYRDDAALERVWARLSVRRHRPRKTGPVTQFLAAAALVGLGIWIGRYVERSTEAAPFASVRREVLLVAGQPGANGDRVLGRDDDEASEGASSGQDAARVAGARPSARGIRRLPSESAGKEASPAEHDAGAESVASAYLAIPRAPWLLLAERGDFAGAVQKLDEVGGFDAALLSAGPDELMTLVDVARSTGRDDRAVQALRIVVERYRADDNAPVAAMMLGNLLSRLGDAEGAAEAFALNRSLSPGGDFAEDALVREFEMAAAARDLATARRLRVQYDKEYPEGRHRDELRAEFEALLAAVEAAEGRVDEGDDQSVPSSSEEPVQHRNSPRSSDELPAKEALP